MKGPNPVIGTVPCPIAGCTQVCSVRKFRPRHATEAGRRKAGKFYFDCPTDGRFGFDGAAAMQEYVLERIVWAEGSAPREIPAKAVPPPAQGAAATRTEGRAAAAAPAARPAPAAKAGSTSPGKQTSTQTPAKRAWWENL